ncbi:MAG: hypothetical protein L0216_13750 [Planctomycetales bacterium]|nr:hypothetical protein [Planctomycetales bacterium]
MSAPLRGRLALAALAWIATAVGAGILLSTLGAERPAFVVGPAVASGRGPGPAPLLPDLAPSPGPADGPHAAPGQDAPRTVALGPDTAVAPASDGAATAGGGPGDSALPGPPGSEGAEGGAAAWFEVTVARASGEPPKGVVVYALPAGVRGVDDEDEVCQVELEDSPTVRLPVPREGLYDLGVVAREGHALLTDLRADRGEVVRASLSVPPGKPITLRCGNPLPRPLAAGATRVEAVVRFRSADRGRSRDFPGRGDEPAVSHTERVASFPGEALSARLPEGVELAVDAWLEETVEKPIPVPRSPGVLAQTRPGVVSHQRHPGTTVLRTDRREVRAGETLDLRVGSRAQLVVRVRLAGVPESGRATFTLRQDAAPEVSGRLKWPASPLGERPLTMALAGTPGPARLSWEGRGIRPGRIEDIVLVEGRDVEREVALEPGAAAGEEPAARDSSAPGAVRVHVEGVPEGSRGDAEAGILAAWLDEDGDPVEERWDVDLEDPEHDFGRAWAHVKRAVLIVDSTHASEPFAVVPGAEVRVAVRRGGLLVVVPEAQYERALGTISVEREDGIPIPVHDGEVARDPDPKLRAAVRPGTILGPFAPGTIRFRVRVGGVPLPETTATVVAGATRPLVIPR